MLKIRRCIVLKDPATGVHALAERKGRTEFYALRLTDGARVHRLTITRTLLKQTLRAGARVIGRKEAA